MREKTLLKKQTRAQGRGAEGRRKKEPGRINRNEGDGWERDGRKRGVSKVK